MSLASKRMTLYVIMSVWIPKPRNQIVFFFFLMMRRPPRSPLFPSPTLFRSAMIGGESISEAEVERLARRSEELARRPPPDRAPTEFDELVADAIDRLPQEFQDVLRTVPKIGRAHV